MKNILTYLVLLLTFFTNAQNTIKLDNDEYSVDIPKTPIGKLMLFHKDANGMKTKANLEKGNYEIFVRPEIKLIFSLNKDSLIDGTITTKVQGNVLTALVKNSKLISLEGYKNKKLFLVGKINHNDSIASTIEYYENGKIKKEVKEFFTKKHYDKKYTINYDKDGNYIINDELNDIQNQFDAKGNIIEEKEEIQDIPAVKVAFQKKEESGYSIFPFAYKNKWGLVDSNGNEIVPPLYKSFSATKNYDLIFLNDKDFNTLKIYSTLTGKELNIKGNYIKLVTVEGEKYAFYNENKKSKLVNIIDQSLISLSLHYKSFDNIDFDENSKNNNKSYKSQYIAGVLDNNEAILLKNNKELTIAKKGRYTDIGVITGNTDEKSYIYYNEGIYLTSKNGYTKFYDKNLRHLTSFTLQNEQLTKKQRKVLSTLLKLKNVSVESCLYELAVIESTENEPIILPSEIKFPEQFTIDKNSEEVYFTNMRGVKQKVETDYYRGYCMLKFGDNNYLFIDSDINKNKAFAFPKKYLKN